MNQKLTLWVIIGLLLVVSLYMTYQAGAVSVETVAPAKVVAKSVASYGGMVGGC